MLASRSVFLFFVVCLCFVSLCSCIVMPISWLNGGSATMSHNEFATSFDTESSDWPDLSTTLTSWIEERADGATRFEVGYDYTNNRWLGSQYFPNYFTPNWLNGALGRVAYQTDLFIHRAAQFGPGIWEWTFQSTGATDRYDVFSFNKVAGHFSYAQPGRFDPIVLEYDMYDTWLTVQMCLDTSYYNQCCFAFGIKNQPWRYVQYFDCPWADNDDFPFVRTANRWLIMQAYAGATSDSYVTKGLFQSTTPAKNNDIATKSVWIQNARSFYY